MNPEKMNSEKEPAEQPVKRKSRYRPRSVAPGRQKGSDAAKKAAALVLEVLAGGRSPTEAAKALGVSTMRYYVMESRALQGLVEACEPRAGGAKARPELKLEKLSREVDTLRRDVARYQALARASQKALGIAAPKPPEKKVGRKKRRKPIVRALKAVEGLRRTIQPTEANVATG